MEAAESPLRLDPCPLRSPGHFHFLAHANGVGQFFVSTHGSVFLSAEGCVRTTPLRYRLGPESHLQTEVDAASVSVAFMGSL